MRVRGTEKGRVRGSTGGAKMWETEEKGESIGKAETGRRLY